MSNRRLTLSPIALLAPSVMLTVVGLVGGIHCSFMGCEQLPVRPCLGVMLHHHRLALGVEIGLLQVRSNCSDLSDIGLLHVQGELPAGVGGRAGARTSVGGPRQPAAPSSCCKLKVSLCAGPAHVLVAFQLGPG